VWFGMFILMLTRIWHEGHDGNSVIYQSSWCGSRRESTRKVEIVYFRGMIGTVTHANTHVLAACTVTDYIDYGYHRPVSQCCV
jgi:hypothetical protein